MVSLLAPSLRRWDRKAAGSAHRYLVNSTAVRRRVADLYGIDAEIVPPPVEVDPNGPATEIEDLAPGFFLCVSRLLPYKNVDAVSEAFRLLPDHRLVVVGSGPLAGPIRAAAPPNVTVLGRVDDASLRWLYRSCAGLVAASHEDFGLTPVEAASFGKPTAALRWGGFLDTIVEGTTGVFFDRPEPRPIAEAVDLLAETRWSSRGAQSPRRGLLGGAVHREDRGGGGRGAPGRLTRPAGAPGQEAPRPRNTVAGVCQRICMSHQNDHEAT